MSWTRNVFSSNVAQVGYDSERKGLVVHWSSGRTSFYEGVSEEQADEVSNAASVGERLNTDIKPFFGHRYI